MDTNQRYAHISHSSSEIEPEQAVEQRGALAHWALRIRDHCLRYTTTEGRDQTLSSIDQTPGKPLAEYVAANRHRHVCTGISVADPTMEAKLVCHGIPANSGRCRGIKNPRNEFQRVEG